MRHVIGFMDALGRLEQRDNNDAEDDVFRHFLLFYQNGSQDMVVDEEGNEEEQQVGPCVKQPVLDPNWVLGIIVEDKLYKWSQKEDKPHDGVDDGLLFGLLEVIAHGLLLFLFISVTKVEKPHYTTKFFQQFMILIQ
jgi:hypothetical protein